MTYTPHAWQYGLAYLLWAVSMILSVFCGLVLRDVYQAIIYAAGWHRYTASAADKFLILAAAIGLLVAFVVTEYLYRTGVEKRRLWPRFSLVTAIELSILGVLHLIRLGLEATYGILDPVLALVVVLELGGALFFWWLYARTSRIVTLSTH